MTDRAARVPSSTTMSRFRAEAAHRQAINASPPWIGSSAAYLVSVLKEQGNTAAHSAAACGFRELNLPPHVGRRLTEPEPTTTIDEQVASPTPFRRRGFVRGLKVHGRRFRQSGIEPAA
jgi:hypothetical protein